MSKLVDNFKRRAKTLAVVMAAHKDMSITIAGSGAWHAPGHINIPNGDFTDPDFVAMANGWVDHELAHESETDSYLFATIKNPIITVNDEHP